MWPDDQLLNPRYLGRDFATELHETYWSKNRFEICIDLVKGTLGHSLENFLWTGAIQHMTKTLHGEYLTPWKKICHLKVNLTCHRRELERGISGEAGLMHHYRTMYGLRLDWTFMQVDMSRLEDQLNVLCLLSGERCHVDIVLHTSFRIFAAAARLRQDERQLVNILESLRKCVCKLMHSNVHVTVIMSNELTSSDVSQPQTSPQPWDITSRFILTAEEWHNVRFHLFNESGHRN
jgi:hypothetical protein